MEHKILMKKNKEEFNKFIVKLNELKEFNEVGSIRALAYNKIMSFIDYCESKDVYYFSELPISKKINDAVVEIVEHSIELDKEATKIIKGNDNKFFVPVLTPLISHLKLNRIRSDYFSLYNVLNEWSFKNVYYKGYDEYYKELIDNNEISHDILDRDYELSIKLGMEEQFLKLKDKYSNCKINVYKIK